MVHLCKGAPLFPPRSLFAGRTQAAGHLPGLPEVRQPGQTKTCGGSGRCSESAAAAVRHSQSPGAGPRAGAQRAPGLGRRGSPRDGSCSRLNIMAKVTQRCFSFVTQFLHRWAQPVSEHQPFLTLRVIRFNVIFIHELVNVQKRAAVLSLQCQICRSLHALMNEKNCSLITD